MSLDEAARAAYRAQKQALQALLDLTGAARDAALNELRSRDTQLAEVVSRRLALCEQAPDESPHATPMPQIPRYRVLHEIGRGGMSRVWLAVRADAADAQKLAIKQIRLDAMDADLTRRFDAERRILTRLDHPHIVPLLDAGTDTQGRPFLVTPYVEGEPIDAWCRSNAQDVRGCVTLIGDIAAALAHAHRQLIVHRDLKPANILVDTGGRVRLLDFGIAKMLDEDPDLTAAGASLMTLRYAAPEQVSGGMTGVSCDLYATGVLLFELLAGSSPYGELRDPAALVHAIAHQDAPPLPARRPNGEKIPRDLAAIVAMLLRKRPEQRYRSADALVDELERWLGAKPVLAMSDRHGYRARQWLRRRWPWVAAALLLTALGVAHTVQLDRQLQATQRERDKAQAVADYFVRLFQSTTPKAARNGEISARELLAGGAEQLKALERETHSPQALAALLTAVSRVHADLGLDAEAIDLSERAVNALRDSGDAIALAEALRSAASAYYGLDRMDEYLARSNEALEVLERGGGQSHPLHARLLGNVGLGYLLRGDYPRAWSYIDRGREQLAAGLPETRADYVRALTNAGGMASVAGDQVRARKLLLEAEREAALLEPRKIDEQLFIARNLATVARETGDFADAQRRYDDLVQRSETFHGAGHPELISALFGRAETEVASGRIDAALRDLDTAQTHAISAYPPEHGQFADIDGMRALALVSRGDLEAAQPMLERNFARREGQVVVEAQPRLEAIALARTRCALDGGDEMREAVAALKSMRNVSEWQLGLARRWAAECGIGAI